ncbi:MAG: hypothetical protein Q8M94_08025 [Ignavibacteria bacterium]|nr:hypothetical protein [Ignavibacteria bacterium]
MKVILIGTNLAKNEEEVGVTVEYVCDDSWIFEFGDISIIVSDLTPVMAFLKSQSEEVK